jgi:hypothetical protein
MGKHGNKEAQIAYIRIHDREKKAQETFAWVMQKPLKGDIDRLEIQKYCQESFAGFRNALIPAVVDYTQVAQGKGSAFDRLDGWLSHLQDSRARFMGIWGRRPWLEGELLAPGGKEPVFFKDQKLPSGETKEPGQREIPKPLDATRNAAHSPEQTKSPTSPRREITTRTSLEWLLRDSPPKPPEADLRAARLPNKDTSNYWRKEESHPKAEEAHTDQLRTLLYRKFGDEIVQSDLLKEQGTSKMDTKVTKIQDGNPAVYREKDGTYFVTYDENNAKKKFGAKEDLSKRRVQLDDALLQKLERNEAAVTWDLPKVFKIPLEKSEGETHMLIIDDEKHAQKLIREQRRDGRVFDFSTTREPGNERRRDGRVFNFSTTREPGNERHRTSRSLDPISPHRSPFTEDYPTGPREAPMNARKRSHQFAFNSDQTTRLEAPSQRAERRPRPAHARSSASEARYSALNHSLSRPHGGEWSGLLWDEQGLHKSKPTNKAWKPSVRSIWSNGLTSVIDTLSFFAW